MAGQAQGVDQRAGADGGAAAVRQAPVDAGVVPDDHFPGQPGGEFGCDGVQAGRPGQDVGAEAGRETASP
jgi:hypothetical protein